MKQGRQNQAFTKSMNHNCNICGIIVLGSIYKLKLHILRCHSNIENPKRCKNCGNKSHMGGSKKGQRKKCTSTIIDKEGLKEIKQYTTLTNERWMDLTKEYDAKRMEREDKAKLHFVHTNLIFPNLRCDVCELNQFQSSLGVLRHVERVHGPQMMLSCQENTCSEKKFSSHYELKKHIKNWHKSSHICEECGKSFVNLYDLKRHKGVYHKKWKIKGRKFNSNAKLVRDLKEDCRCNIELSGKRMSFHRKHFQVIHLGYEECVKCKITLMQPSLHTCKPKKKSIIKSFQCGMCHVVKTYPYMLKDHMQRIHNPETLIKCKFCIKYLTEREVKYHSCQYLPMQRRKCDICGKMVAKLETHKDTVHKSNVDKKCKCEHCNKGFFDKNHLKSHVMNVHLKLRPYKCRYGCDQDYNDRSNRRQHEKRAHGVIGPRVEINIKK